MHRLDTVIRQIDHSVTALKRISRNSVPESLLLNGLEEALQELCLSLQNHQTAISFRSYGIREGLPATFRADVFFITREIIRNAVEHAEAANITVQCTREANAFKITVEDNGKGFDIAAASGETASGIDIVKNRVTFLRGKTTIVSEINKGTTFIIELDLPD